MRPQQNRKGVALSFLVTFLLFGIVNVHAYSHFADDKEELHCDQCALVASINELTATLDGVFGHGTTGTPIVFQNVAPVFPAVATCSWVVQPEEVHNKPPPILRV